MTLWSASDPASPLFVPLRGSKNSDSLPPISSLSSPAPIPAFCFSLNPLFLFLSFLSALSFGLSPPPFCLFPLPLNNITQIQNLRHHTGTSASGMGVGGLLCGILILPVTFSPSLNVNTGRGTGQTH